MRHEIIILQRTHAVLEEKLRRLMREPTVNSLEIARVKMEKLRVKDRIEAIKRHDNARKWDRESSVRGGKPVCQDIKGAGGSKLLISGQSNAEGHGVVSVGAAIAAATASAVSVFGTAMLAASA